MSLRIGRWEDVLADVECDAVICDPPYSARSQSGHDRSTDAAARDGHPREAIDYAHWDSDDVEAFVSSWSPRTRGWIVALTSHDLIPAWEAAHARAGRYCFAPVPCVITGMTLRISGDGPSSWAVYAVVARPKSKAMARWGTLPGAYLSPRVVSGAGGGRGKPIDLMRALVRDYSRPGDLVCDPCAGYGTTGRAALSMGRRFVGAECDEDAYREALVRLGRPMNGELFGEVAP